MRKKLLAGIYIEKLSSGIYRKEKRKLTFYIYRKRNTSSFTIYRREERAF